MSEPATKKQKTVDIVEEETLLGEIDQIQEELDDLNEKASEEILKIEQTYNRKRKPFFDRRSKIIGKIDTLSNQSRKPNFWVTTFLNHPRISNILQDQEEECLHYMTKLNVEDFDDVKTGYTIAFHFKENPFFDNTLLQKEFHLAAEGNQTTEEFNQTSISTQIKWKDGKNLLKEMQSKPQTNKKRDIDHKSFFDWFTDNSDPVNDDIAEIIKEDIWPNPLQYYLVPDLATYEESSVDEDSEDEEEGKDGQSECEEEDAE